MKLRLERINYDKWILASRVFKDYNFQHFWSYSKEAASRVGANSEHIAIIDENERVVALFNARIKKIPYGLGGVAYISGGVMVDCHEGAAAESLKAVLPVVENEYVTKLGLVLRISLRARVAASSAEEALVYRQLEYAEYGKTNATILVSLSETVEIIRKRLHQKWRNILKRSEKAGLVLISGTSPALFNDFEELFLDLLQKKKFKVDMDPLFFNLVQQKSTPPETFYLTLAYFDGVPVSGHLASLAGDTSTYLLGATNKLGRKLGAAYLLQWHVIEESKRHGCLWYDLGGIDSKENPDVYRFKKRMGGQEIDVRPVFQKGLGFRKLLTLALEKSYRVVIAIFAR